VAVGMCVLTGCPGADAGVGAATTATPTTGTTGAAESSTGVDTLADGSGDGTTAAPTAEVSCGEMPLAAVGADYDHGFEVDPSAGSWTWSVEGLPEGLMFSALSGTISGAPTEEGSFELLVSVEGTGGVGESVCTLEVAPALSADLSGLARPCLGPGDVLADVVVGGDGSALTCSTPMTSGAGTRPDTVEVDAETCAIEGEPTAEEYGTWVWITEVEQSGARTFVPFCISQDTPAEGAFEVTMTFGDDTDALLEPLVGSFNPEDPLAFGGMGDPAFTVIGGCGTSACYYGYAFAVGASPFGGECGQDNCFGLSPSQLVTDGSGPIGFSHELFAYGPIAPDAFHDRPFVLPWNLTYCIADNADDCDGNEAVQTNAGARAHVSLLMLPE